ncbi:hypothetical protein ACV3QH_15495 [Clostridium perfringens]
MAKMNKFERLIKDLGGLEKLIELVNKYKAEGLSQDDITNNVIKEAKKVDEEINVSSSLLFKKIIENGYSVVGWKPRYVQKPVTSWLNFTNSLYRVFHKVYFLK